MEPPGSRQRTPPTGCPICHGKAGDRTLKVRIIGKSTTHGVPLIASVTTVEMQQGSVGNICPACYGGLRWKKVVAAILPMLVAVLAAALQLRFQGWFIVLALFVAGTVLHGTMYSWGDKVMWGSDLVRKFKLQGDVQFPVSFRHVLLRCVLFLTALMFWLARATAD